MMRYTGVSDFEGHYASLYGSRWPGISKGLQRSIRHVNLIPPFFSHIPEQLEMEEAVSSDVSVEELNGSMYYRSGSLPLCYKALEFNKANHHNPDPNTIALYEKKAVFNANSFVSTVAECACTIDYGVAYACHCLGVEPGDKVLDMFGHTGRHSLIFASLLFYHNESYTGILDESKSTTEVVALINKLKEKTQTNDNTSLLVCSESRRGMHEKSVETLGRYLPEKLLNSMSIQCVCYDPEDSNLQRFGKFNRIFIRIPQLMDNSTLGKWNMRSVKASSKKALAALNAAVKLLKDGGSIIYCTHSLDPMENELVIHTVLDSSPCLRHEPIDLNAILETLYVRLNWKVDLSDLPNVETRTYGCALMPDETPYGPIYMCKIVLQKKHTHH